MKIINLMENESFCDNLACEHGLSFYIETKKHHILFDTGATEAFAENAEKLGVDLSKVDLMFLSHGHYDHGGGIAKFLEVNKKAKLYIRRTAFAPFYNIKSDPAKYIGISPELENSDRVVLTDVDGRIDDEISYFTNVTGRKLWPDSNRMLQRKTENGYTLDDFSHEQNLVIQCEGKTILFSGCSHNGCINIMEAFQKQYGTEPDVYIGGFHMMKETSYTEEEADLIKNVAEYLKQTKTVYYTCHCTGHKALRIMEPVLEEQLKTVHTGDHITV